ncbi:MAG: 3-oxoacyl-ACP reductase FabG [Clostridia bacterium]|nr:3-oxoacyl-ACP reductase FabG [Clostridia bacterium]
MKKVLITGGTRGIGEATAKLLAKNGYKVYINYLKSDEKAQKLAQEIGVVPVKADVSSPKETKEMFDLVGGVDVLINNAGIAQQKLFTDITSDEWERMLGVNLTGVFNCTKGALPYMINKKSGCIINISSMWGICGASCEVHYSAAKAGVIGFSKALAKEVGPSGIRVNCIAPGMIDTEMNNGFDDETVEMIKEETPLGIIGKPEDIANCVLYLIEQGQFITGQVISPNGGMVI